MAKPMWSFDRSERHNLSLLHQHKHNKGIMVTMRCEDCNLSFKGDGKTMTEAKKIALKSSRTSPCFDPRYMYP